MLRISPWSSKARISRSGQFLIEPGGSEANVAVALAQLDEPVSLVSSLAKGVLSDKIIRYLKANSVDTSCIVSGKGRTGLYWTETGSGPRPSEVFYDRDDSAFANSFYGDFNWKEILQNAGWFHTSGINPALSERSCILINKILSSLKSQIAVSVDLNYRSKLWKWADPRVKIYKAMWQICAKASLITSNENDLCDALGLEIKNRSGGQSYERAAIECFSRLPRLKFLGISLRKSFNADHNDWSGILFVKTGKTIKFYTSKEFRLTRIVDRVGAGDCFSAGLIFGIRNFKNDFQRMLDFAVALSALKHTVRGDASQFSQADVQAILNNPGAKIVR
jgi:2-dehydro-3-deoxygluconokinase